jgi:hypothetical protein
LQSAACGHSDEVADPSSALITPATRLSYNPDHFALQVLFDRYGVVRELPIVSDDPLRDPVSERCPPSSGGVGQQIPAVRAIAGHETLGPRWYESICGQHGCAVNVGVVRAGDDQRRNP